MPQHDPGIRSDPAPSPPCPIGTIRAATAAALPPLDPPVVRFRLHGFRHGPRKVGSVETLMANSGVFVFLRL